MFRTLLNEFLNTCGEGGIPYFFSDFFCRWFDFYTNSYKSPNSLRVIHVVSDIVCSVAQSATCDGESLRIIFKLPLLEAEDSSQTTASGSLFCCSRPKICSPSKFLYRRPWYVDYINFNWNKYIFSSTTKEHAPHHLDSESSTNPLHTLKKRTRNENKNKETINTKQHKDMRPRPGAIFLPTLNHRHVPPVTKRVADVEPGTTISYENGCTRKIWGRTTDQFRV